MSRRKKVSRGNPAARMTLYHYTHEAHIPSILASGLLRLTESNISFSREHAGPDVLWLTSNPDLLGSTSDGLRMMDGKSKAQVRFTVSVPVSAAKSWADWARQKGSLERTMSILSKDGGSSAWFVVESPIERSDWLAIDR